MARPNFDDVHVGLDGVVSEPPVRSAPRLGAHPERPGVFVEMTPDGPDYITVCERHQWCSPSSPDISCCPMCVATADAIRGRDRYLEMRARIKLGL